MKINNGSSIKPGDIKDIISQLDLKDKVGQMLMVGFSGKEITSELQKLLEQYKFGGVIYFARNLESPQQVFKLSQKLHKLVGEITGLPLLLAADEEGGIVTRIPAMTYYPGGMCWGAAAEKQILEKMAASKAKQLRYLGINHNLSPVLDVNNNPQNPIIGNRSMGSDPGQVAKLGQAYIRGLQSEGVAACGKHFPGHGDTTVDSHHDLPVMEHDQNRLHELELIPFKVAIKAGVASIMSAHLALPALTGDRNKPATLSPEVINELLREKLNFSGLIITDCLEMQGISKLLSPAEGAVRAIEAGCDIALISHSSSWQSKAAEKLIKAVRAGRIPEERIDKSLERIINLKIKVAREYSQSATYSEEKFAHLRQRGNKIAREIAGKAITSFPNTADYLPLKPEKISSLWLIDIEGRKDKAVVEKGSKGKERQYIKALAAELAQADFKVKSLSGGWQQKLKKLLEETHKSYQPGEANQPAIIVLLKEVEKNLADYSILKELAQSSLPAVFIVQDSPYCLRALKEAEILVAYDSSSAHITPLAEIICGELKAAGNIPVDLGEEKNLCC